MSEKIKPFNQFYLYYLDEHKNKTNKRLHFIGTSLVIFIFVYALIIKQYQLIWLCPLMGYGFAWPGHFIFEKNRPATFKQPLYSLMSDFVMWFHILTGKVKI